MKPFDSTTEHEVERAQSEYRERIRGEHDERLTRERENRRNRVYRKDDVARFQT